MIACGGVGRLDHVADVIAHGKADAVSLASMIHYDFIKSNRIDADYSQEGNVEFLKKGTSFSKMETAGIADIKQFLIARGIACRPASKELARA